MSEGNAGPSRAIDRREGPLVVVLRHHQRVPLGVLADPLAARVKLLELRGYEDGGAAEAVRHLVDAGAYDGVIALGGPQGAYERDRFPYLDDSLHLLRDALRRDVPILGLCLGSQLLAEAAGAVVYPGRDRGFEPEVGFFPLHVTEAGARDPVVALYAQPEPLLFWHQDTHDLPPGALLLAATDAYPVAAYRVRTRAYGIQFHLESAAEGLEEWARTSPLPARAGVDPWEIVEEARRRDAGIRSRASRLADLFARWAAGAYRERISRTRASASSGEEA